MFLDIIHLDMCIKVTVQDNFNLSINQSIKFSIIQIMKKQLHTLFVFVLSIYASYGQTFSTTTTISDLAANKGTKLFTFFSFSTGEEVAAADSNSNKWDIAFSGTTILFNGGTKGPSTVAAQYITPSTFEAISEVPTSDFTLNSLSGNGSWYDYNPGVGNSGPHTIIPISDKIIVVKLENGSYVKLQILNYYQGAPSEVPTTGPAYDGVAKYYTFKYVLSDVTDAFNDTYTVSDLGSDKGTGKYTFFSFGTGEEVAAADSNSLKWDIAFSGTTVLFNGGTKGPGTVAAQYLTPSTFESIIEAPTTGYTLNSISGSGSWYTYYPGSDFSGPHTVLPIADKIILLKVQDSKYVKLQILNYYQGTPTDVPTTGPAYTGVGKYLTFRYAFTENVTLPEIPTSVLTTSSKVISIYPNPISSSSAELTIDSDVDTGSLKIMDLIGNEVYAAAINNSTMQLTNLNLVQGIYVVILESEGKLYQQKLIVK